MFSSSLQVAIIMAKRGRSMHTASNCASENEDIIITLFSFIIDFKLKIIEFITTQSEITWLEALIAYQSPNIYNAALKLIDVILR